MSLTRDLMHAAVGLGLVVDRHRATGVVDGRRVTVWVSFAGSNRETVHVRGALDPPLDLGVLITKGAHSLLTEAAMRLSSNRLHGGADGGPYR